MSYNLVINLLKPSKSKRPGIALQATTITVHNTSNKKSSARNERGWLDNIINFRKASWHYCVGDTEVIQAIPTNEVSYHAQNQGWRTSIGVEICESNWEVTRVNAVKFLATLLYERNWGVNKLRQHDYWYKKGCPRVIIAEGWDKFLSDVKAELDKLNKPSIPKLTRVLKNGCEGKDVLLLQSQLKLEGYKIKVDGVFGDETEKVVRDYQKKNNLTVDGQVYKLSWGKLFS